MTTHPRVFIGLKEIAGHYRGLKRGFDELGVPCTFVNLKMHEFKYGGETSNWLIRLLQKARHPKAPKYLRLLKRPLIGALFTWALVNHDIFIFGFATSFFKRYRDLPVLKFFGKTIIYQFHGSDSRPPYINGSAMAPSKGVSIDECIKMTRRKKEDILAIDRYADVIIDTPQQGIFHERPFVLWLCVGLPNQCDPPGKSPDQDQQDSRVRVLHCPSNPEAKGTDEIRRMVTILQDEGLPIQYIELMGQENAVVLKELERCDIVIDQLYADYGMPGFATETAWFGKPLLIGGYAREEWDAVLPPEAVPPTHYCHPDDFLNTLRQLIMNPVLREASGFRARHFVETQWRASQIAQRYLDLAKGNIPDKWLYDPNNTRYWKGCCFHQEQTRTLIASVIETGGIEALQLQDKPALEQVFKEAAAYRETPVEASAFAAPVS